MELKEFLDQVDLAMPDTLIQQQAKECYTYSIARAVMADQNSAMAKQKLFNGLLASFAEKEGTTPENC